MELLEITEVPKECTAQELQAIIEIAQKSYLSPFFRSFSEIVAHFSYTQNHYLFLSVEKEAVGFLGYHQVLDEAQLLNVAILPNVQRRGYGRKFLKFFLKKMKENEISTIFLEVRPSNVAAKRLYDSLGFRVSYVRKNYYHFPTEDALMMKLSM